MIAPPVTVADLVSRQYLTDLLNEAWRVHERVLNRWLFLIPHDVPAGE